MMKMNDSFWGEIIRKQRLKGQDEAVEDKKQGRACSFVSQGAQQDTLICIRRHICTTISCEMELD